MTAIGGGTDLDRARRIAELTDRELAAHRRKCRGKACASELHDKAANANAHLARLERQYTEELTDASKS